MLKEREREEAAALLAKKKRNKNRSSTAWGEPEVWDDDQMGSFFDHVQDGAWARGEESLSAFTAVAKMKLFRLASAQHEMDTQEETVASEVLRVIDNKKKGFITVQDIQRFLQEEASISSIGLEDLCLLCFDSHVNILAPNPSASTCDDSSKSSSIRATSFQEFDKEYFDKGEYGEDAHSEQAPDAQTVLKALSSTTLGRELDLPSLRELLSRPALREVTHGLYGVAMNHSTTKKRHADLISGKSSGDGIARRRALSAEADFSQMIMSKHNESFLLSPSTAASSNVLSSPASSSGNAATNRTLGSFGSFDDDEVDYDGSGSKKMNGQIVDAFTETPNANPIPTKFEESDLGAFFSAVDSNNDGFISPKDMMVWVASMGGIGFINSEEVDSLFMLELPNFTQKMPEKLRFSLDHRRLSETAKDGVKKLFKAASFKFKDGEEGDGEEGPRRGFSSKSLHKAGSFTASGFHDLKAQGKKPSFGQLLKSKLSSKNFDKQSWHDEEDGNNSSDEEGLLRRGRKQPMVVVPSGRGGLGINDDNDYFTQKVEGGMRFINNGRRSSASGGKSSSSSRLSFNNDDDINVPTVSKESIAADEKHHDEMESCKKLAKKQHIHGKCLNLATLCSSFNRRPFLAARLMLCLKLGEANKAQMIANASDFDELGAMTLAYHALKDLREAHDKHMSSKKKHQLHERCKLYIQKADDAALYAMDASNDEIHRPGAAPQSEVNLVKELTLLISEHHKGNRENYNRFNSTVMDARRRLIGLRALSARRSLVILNLEIGLQSYILKIKEAHQCPQQLNQVKWLMHLECQEEKERKERELNQAKLENESDPFSKIRRGKSDGDFEYNKSKSVDLSSPTATRIDFGGLPSPTVAPPSGGEKGQVKVGRRTARRSGFDNSQKQVRTSSNATEGDDLWATLMQEGGPGLSLRDRHMSVERMSIGSSLEVNVSMDKTEQFDFNFSAGGGGYVNKRRGSDTSTASSLDFDGRRRAGYINEDVGALFTCKDSYFNSFDGFNLPDAKVVGESVPDDESLSSHSSGESDAEKGKIMAPLPSKEPVVVNSSPTTFASRRRRSSATSVSTATTKTSSGSTARSAAGSKSRKSVRKSARPSNTTSATGSSSYTGSSYTGSSYTGSSASSRSSSTSSAGSSMTSYTRPSTASSISRSSFSSQQTNEDDHVEIGAISGFSADHLEGSDSSFAVKELGLAPLQKKHYIPRSRDQYDDSTVATSALNDSSSDDDDDASIFHSAIQPAHCSNSLENAIDMVETESRKLAAAKKEEEDEVEDDEDDETSENSPMFESHMTSRSSSSDSTSSKTSKSESIGSSILTKTNSLKEVLLSGLKTAASKESNTSSSSGKSGLSEPSEADMEEFALLDDFAQPLAHCPSVLHDPHIRTHHGSTTVTDTHMLNEDQHATANFKLTPIVIHSDEGFGSEDNHSQRKGRKVEAKKKRSVQPVPIPKRAMNIFKHASSEGELPDDLSLSGTEDGKNAEPKSPDVLHPITKRRQPSSSRGSSADDVTSGGSSRVVRRPSGVSPVRRSPVRRTSSNGSPNGSSSRSSPTSVSPARRGLGNLRKPSGDDVSLGSPTSDVESSEERKGSSRGRPAIQRRLSRAERDNTAAASSSPSPSPSSREITRSDDSLDNGVGDNLPRPKSPSSAKPSPKPVRRTKSPATVTKTRRYEFL